MKTVLKNVYYCDYCGKRGLSKYHMTTHELHCTKNPNRICGFCGNKGVSPELIIEINNSFKTVETKNIFQTIHIEWNSKPITHESLLDMVDGCPGCALALFRQSNLCSPELYDEVGFDFQRAKMEYWREHNDDEEREMMYG